MAKKLRIITTGGTFDKLYDPIRGDLTFDGSRVPQILVQSRCALEVEQEGPLAIDSLFMNDGQRKEVARLCLGSPEERVVVVHGTDTMAATAKVVLESRPEGDRHTIVFTGAMVPFSLEKSDAVFNIGFAVAAAQLLPPGVYIAMNGLVFPADKVRKDRDAGRFVGESL